MDSPLNLLNNAIKNFCQAHGFDQTYWIGYSGGLDSHVLLHLFAAYQKECPSLKIRAVHIHHGLNSKADQWETHCLAVCEALKINFISRRITLPLSHTSNKSPEEIARDYRYGIFEELLQPQDMLLTAHQQDDQAETLLLQLCRGAGPKGLAAMPIVKSFAKGFLARPLLSFSRVILKQYAEEHNLHWIHDESNDNVSFTRNFLRHDVLPILKNRWPSVTKILARVADNCGETQYLLNQMAEQDLHQVAGRMPGTLSIKKILDFDEIRQRHVLRAWLAKKHFPIPNAVKLRQIQQDMLHAREDRAPYFSWRGVELRRYQDDLYAMLELSQHNALKNFEWDLSQPLLLSGLGILSVKLSQLEGLRMRTNLKNMTVRFRCGGEAMQLPGRPRQSLKNLFQSWGIPSWERDRVPLIFVDNILAAIPGYGINEGFVAEDNQAGYVLIYQKDVNPANKSRDS